MPTSQLHVIERTGLDGPLSPWAAVVLGVLLGVLAGWLLLREREAVGNWGGVAIFLLRTVAMGVVLWMLVGPVHITIERLSAPQCIAIVADASGSMDVVDPPDPADDARWQAAGSMNPQAVDLVAVDRATADLQYAARLASQLRTAIADHRSLPAIETILKSLRTSAMRAADHADKFANAIDGDDLLVERAKRLSALLATELAESLDRFGELLEKEDDADLYALAAAADALEMTLIDGSRRANNLAADAAEGAAERLGEADRPVPARRGEKVAATLAVLEAGPLMELNNDVQLERLRFDDAVEPTTAGAWERDEAADPLADSTKMPDDARYAADSADIGDEQRKPAERGTDLTGVLDYLGKLKTQKDLTLTLLFSDGRHNSAGDVDPQDAAAQSGQAPLFIVPVGNSAPLRDVLIHRVDAPSTVIKGDQVKIDVIVTAFQCAGESTRIVLRHKGRLIQAKPLVFKGDQADCHVTFVTPADEVGWQELELDVEPLDEEASAANNLAASSLEVVRDDLKILLVDGKPRWEFRYLQQLFARDKHFKCDELVFAPEPTGTGAVADTLEIPRDEKSWNRYDAVILGDVSPKELTHAAEESLDRYVREHGGNVVVIAGRDSMPAAFAGRPLMELLPVERSTLAPAGAGYSLVLGEEARFQSAVLIADDFDASRREWQALGRRTPLYGISTYCRPRATARTVIEAAALDAAFPVRTEPGAQPERAFMAWHQVGAGRVVYIAAPQTYLLRYRSGDRLHHRFWGQLLRWITAPQMGAGSELVKLSTDRVRYETARPVETTVWLRDQSGRPVSDADMTAVAKSPDGDRQEIELAADGAMPGRYVGRFERLAAGAYEISPHGADVDRLLALTPKEAAPVRTLVSIHASGGFEMMNTCSNRSLLEQLATETGGQVIPPTAVEEILHLASLAPSVTESVERRPLWNRWQALVAIVGCLSVEWVMRKRMGLV